MKTKCSLLLLFLLIALAILAGCGTYRGLKVSPPNTIVIQNCTAYKLFVSRYQKYQECENGAARHIFVAIMPHQTLLINPATTNQHERVTFVLHAINENALCSRGINVGNYKRKVVLGTNSSPRLIVVRNRDFNRDRR